MYLYVAADFVGYVDKNGNHQLLASHLRKFVFFAQTGHWRRLCIIKKKKKFDMYHF